MRERPKKGRGVYEDDGLNLTHHQKKLRYLKARRDMRRLQINLVRFRALARIAAILIIAFGFLKLINLPQWNLDANIFNTYPNVNLQIEGNEIVSTSRILAQLRQVKLPHKPIYLINTKGIEKSLLKLSPVKKVYIRRFWFPARLKIVVDERIPVLSLAPSPQSKPIAVFTDDNTIINREFLPLNYHSKVYTVLTYDDFYKWSGKHVNYLVYFAKLLESASGEKLRYLDIRNPDDVFVQFDNIKLRIGELNNTVFKRTKRVSSVLSEALKIRDDIDYIDLRWENSVSIKLKNKETAQAEVKNQDE